MSNKATKAAGKMLQENERLRTDLAAASERIAELEAAQNAEPLSLLKKLEGIWPDDLWIFAADSQLYVMRKGPAGEHVMTSNGGVDPTMEVITIQIEADGGDW